MARRSQLVGSCLHKTICHHGRLNQIVQPRRTVTLSAAIAGRASDQRSLQLRAPYQKVHPRQGPGLPSMRVAPSRSRPLSCCGRSGCLASHTQRQLVPVALTREHLQTTCASYAYHCWTLGILPAEVFFLFYPAHPDWFTATLRAMLAVAADPGR